MQPRHTWLPLAFDWVARWRRPSGLSVVEQLLPEGDVRGEGSASGTR